MCAEAGGSHDILLDIRKGQRVQKQGIEDSCGEHTTPGHYFRVITIGISSNTTHMAVFCVLLSCGGYSEKRTGGKICSGPLSEVEHRGLC